MVSLAERFPEAEASIRERIEDIVVPSEPVVQTCVEEDAAGRCWVTVACPVVEFSRQAAFAPEDLSRAAGIWAAWCDRILDELDRRLRERGRSGW